MFNSRICLILEAGAELELLEQFEAQHSNANTSNIVVQIELGESAVLQHVRLVQEPDETGLITRTEVSQRADSEYAYYGFDLGGGLVRHDLHCSLLGSGARASLNGAYLLDGKRHVDNHARVDHMAPDGFSEQYFRGVAGGSSKAVFNTAVYVHPGADGTEAKQSNANILLSKRAEIDTKPELEIYADEVIAAHGATVGQLDEQAVFYLRSRGLSEVQARQLLTTAFCRSVSDKLAGGKMADDKLAEAMSQRMMDVMPRAE
jgi:Fe-S cluster assembly protein SufD